MRAREILQEDYAQSLESDLNNLLVGTKANGVHKINTKDVADQLYGMGYAVDVNSLMASLSQNPMVANATPEMINLVSDDASLQGTGDSSQDSASRVQDMAQKANKLS